MSTNTRQHGDIIRWSEMSLPARLAALRRAFGPPRHARDTEGVSVRCVAIWLLRADGRGATVTEIAAALRITHPPVVKALARMLPWPGPAGCAEPILAAVFSQLPAAHCRDCARTGFAQLAIRRWPWNRGGKVGNAGGGSRKRGAAKTSSRS